MEMPVPVMLTAAEPGFESVTVCATLVDPKIWFVNVRLPGVALTACTPVPVRETDCVPAPSLILSVPVCKPVVLGLKVTAMRQLLVPPKGVVVVHVVPSVP